MADLPEAEYERQARRIALEDVVTVRSAVYSVQMNKINEEGLYKTSNNMGLCRQVLQEKTISIQL